MLFSRKINLGYFDTRLGYFDTRQNAKRLEPQGFIALLKYAVEDIESYTVGIAMQSIQSKGSGQEARGAGLSSLSYIQKTGVWHAKRICELPSIRDAC